VQGLLHELGGVQALRDGLDIRDVSLKLLSGLGRVEGDNEFEGKEVFDLEGLGVVLLGVDQNNFVVFIQVVELEDRLVLQALAKGCLGLLDQLSEVAG
jgi:hypothetical protein